MGRKQYTINQSIFEQRQISDVPIEVRYSSMGRISTIQLINTRSLIRVLYITERLTVIILLIYI